MKHLATGTLLFLSPRFCYADNTPGAAVNTVWLMTAAGFVFFMSDITPWNAGFILFQTMLAATTATICSGAMAERAQFRGYSEFQAGVLFDERNAA